MFSGGTEMRYWLEMDSRLLTAQSYRGYIHQLHICIYYPCCSPRNSTWQSAIADGFPEANSVFIVITPAKILLR